LAAGRSSFKNLYLLAAIRGGFEPRTLPVPVGTELDLLHILDHRWGISPPWGACDAGADLESPGDDIVRAWTHVDLRVSNDSPFPEDVAASGLLRSMWDALELYGTATLTGIDVSLPADCAAEPMWSRVARSVVRDFDHALPRTCIALVEVGTAWPGAPAIDWDADAILVAFAELVDVDRVMEGVARASYPESPKSESPFAASDTETFRVEAKLPLWTIDHAAWLAEAMAVSCHGSGITQDIQVSIRR
jgi:hypothetical protein